jgi:hypothetical protein
MRANNPSNSSEVQKQNYNLAMESFADRPEFPITDTDDLEQHLKRVGQRPLYRALVDTYGREAAIDGLSNLLAHDVVRLQVGALVPLEVSELRAESQS